VRGCFVTGTDTGAGKTVLAASIVAALAAAGERVAAFKPVVTGLDEPAGDWPADHELLALAAGGGVAGGDVCAAAFGPAVSPHLAAQLAGVELTLDVFVAAAAAAARAAGAGAALVVEGVGGLLVPFNDRHGVRDLAVALGLAVIIAARPGLGTINHALLTLKAARAVGLEVRGVVLTPWPEQPSVMERSNHATIERLGSVEVATLPLLAPRIDELAAAGAALPLQRWIAARPAPSAP